MRWIQVSTPFVHSSSGCCNIDQIGAQFENSSIFESPTTTAFELQSELLEIWIPDQVMHWIALSSPFVYSASGCYATMKVGVNFRRSRVFLFTHTTTALNYNQDFCEDEFQTYLMLWIRLHCLFVDSCFGCWVTIINIQGRKNPANIFIHQ